MASCSSSSSHSWKYDAFLSFRGEDTRKTIVDHLYAALTDNRIQVYKDDETLPRGELIAPALFKGIEGSQIAIVVFSEDYANSSWCLKELAHIMKCKEERGQTVMPVFYHVDPSDVRKRKFGEAFAEHIESENKNSVETWRKALADAGNHSGWVIDANGFEAKVIKEIVAAISETLNSSNPKGDDKLVGINTRSQDLISEMEIGSGEVRVVGIWGIGGGGKTTLAWATYDEISSRFDGCCFIENIREISSKINRLKKLQKKMLRKVLNQEEIKIDGVEAGKRLIRTTLCRRQVLIVLDDVDHPDQLHALARSHDWFGRGSRIIITTRNVHLLNAHGVKVIHNIRLLNYVEADQLFGKYACLDDRRTIEDYETLSRRVIFYARGLPLALKVLGSFLGDKCKEEWMSALAKLKDIPNDDIVQKLKISFDGLAKDEKEMFLDIACLPVFDDGVLGDGLTVAKMILNACGFHASIGLQVLTQKALVTIRDYGRISMHDLVREMGHHIVRGKHPKNPEKHSRVWKKEDVEKLCDVVATQENYTIEALDVDLYDYEKNGDDIHFRESLPQAEETSIVRMRVLSRNLVAINISTQAALLSTNKTRPD